MEVVVGDLAELGVTSGILSLAGASATTSPPTSGSSSRVHAAATLESEIDVDCQNMGPQELRVYLAGKFGSKVVADNSGLIDLVIASREADAKQVVKQRQKKKHEGSPSKSSNPWPSC